MSDAEHRSQYLTVNEAAEILRVHPHVIYRLLAAGELRAFRVGRQYRIAPRAIEELELADSRRVS